MSASGELTGISWPHPPNGFSLWNSRVKITEPLDQRFIFVGLVVDVEVLVVHLFALVDELHESVLLERHLCIAVQGATCIGLVVRIRGRREQRRLERVDDRVPQAEEIAQRHDDAWSRRIVPREPQAGLPGTGSKTNLNE